MLKIKDSRWEHFKEHYKAYGFNLEPEKSYYYKKLNDDVELFIWKTKKADYEDKCLYIETKYHNTLVYDLDTLLGLYYLLEIKKEGI